MKRTRNYHGNILIGWETLVAVVLLSFPLRVFPVEREKPYKGYTGTVHQFGFIGGIYNTANPNFPAEDQTRTYHDYGLGAAYTMHDYVTRQFAFDMLTSITVITAKSLESGDSSGSRQKIVWPLDCRFNLGPSEDFQAYIGTGLQWNMLEKTVGEYDIISGSAPTKTIHQLSGNTAIGLNVFGPQNYLFHLNVGAKFHYTIAGNSRSEVSTADLSKDRSCIILNGGITLDVDRRKNACLMLNYEYPLGQPEPSGYASGGFWSRTQTVTLGLMFHIGGTR